MCDAITEAENAAWLGRREFTLAGASAALLVAAPGCQAAEAPPPGLPTRARAVRVPTADGRADGWLIAPTRGTHPGVILWPDIAGLRPAYRALATRLAAAGHAVLAINPYYRNAPAPVLSGFAEWRTAVGQARLAPMLGALTTAAVARDGAAFVRWLDAQREVDRARQLGVCGYCLSGPFAVRTAAAAAERVGAVASFHGADLVSAAPDSPVHLLGATRAAFLFAIARNDDERQPEAKTALRAAAAAAQRPAEIEVYPAQHGWCTPDTPVYDAAQADRAWARLLALFRRAL